MTEDLSKAELHRRAHAILADFVGLGQPAEKAIAMIRDLGLDEASALEGCLTEYQEATARIELKIAEWLAFKLESRN